MGESVMNNANELFTEYTAKIRDLYFADILSETEANKANVRALKYARRNNIKIYSGWDHSELNIDDEIKRHGGK